MTAMCGSCLTLATVLCHSSLWKVMGEYRFSQHLVTKWRDSSNLRNHNQDWYEIKHTAYQKIYLFTGSCDKKLRYIHHSYDILDATIRLWAVILTRMYDIRVGTCQRDFAGHTGSITDVQVCIFIYFYWIKRTLIPACWDAWTQIPLTSAHWYLRCAWLQLHDMRGDKQLFSSSIDGHVKLWDIRDSTHHVISAVNTWTHPAGGHAVSEHSELQSLLLSGVGWGLAKWFSAPQEWQRCVSRTLLGKSEYLQRVRSHSQRFTVSLKARTFRVIVLK